MNATAIRLIPPLFVLLWATGFIGARYAMPWAEPFSFLALRFVLAAACLAILILLFRARRLGPRDAMRAMFAGALIHGVYLGGVFWAIRNGMPAGLSALLMGLQPLITAFLAGMFLGERVRMQHWIGLAIGLAGVAMVLAPQIGGLGGVTPATFAACCIAVLSISAGTVWQKRFLTGTDLVTGTLWQYLGAALLMLVAALALETGAYTLTSELVFAMAWLIFVLSIGAIFLLMYLIREGEVSRVSALFYLVPGVTAVLAFLLFGETLSVAQVAGMAVTAAGVGLAVRAAPASVRPDSA